MFEDLEDDEFLEDEAFEAEEEGEEEESGNRTFVLAAIFLGALTIVALLCIGGYLWLQSNSGTNLAGQNTQAAEQAANQAAEQAQLNTQEADMVQMTVAASWTDTPTASPAPTDTPEPTDVVVLPSGGEGEGGTEGGGEGGSAGGGEDAPATATIAALLTQAAGQSDQDDDAIATISVAVTELPDTGLFDDLNVNGMILLAFFAVVVIFLARRMRAVSR